MNSSQRFRQVSRLCLPVVTAVFVLAGSARTQVTLTQLSQDTIPTPRPTTFPFPLPQHETEVEPGAFSFGSTMVAAFQVARDFDGGGADIGFATSRDAGNTWTNGYLPGISIWEGGVHFTASDPSVAYDAQHNVWLISSLALASFVDFTSSIIVSRSTDALNWSAPIYVSHSSTIGPPYPDKNWTACDNNPSSPFYGHCYTEWETTLIQMSTSTDGGLTWSKPLPTGSADFGVGGIPMMQPNGTVIVPINNFSGTVIAFISTDGGQSWSKSVNVSGIISHQEAGGVRSANAVSAAMDAAGQVYVMWSDCRFRKKCTTNDIVYSSSADGINWGPVTRVPIDPLTSTVDHFITGLSIAPGTSGPTAQLALVYYYYPVSRCGERCQLYAGFIQSSTAGASWSAPTTLAGPIQLSWLPLTFSGRMVADYISVGFAAGKWFPIFSVAQQPTDDFQQAIYTTTGQQLSRPEQEPLSSAGDRPVPHPHSDHAAAERRQLERFPFPELRP